MNFGYFEHTTKMPIFDVFSFFLFPSFLHGQGGAIFSGRCGFIKSVNITFQGTIDYSGPGIYVERAQYEYLGENYSFLTSLATDSFLATNRQKRKWCMF